METVDVARLQWTVRASVSYVHEVHSYDMQKYTYYNTGAVVFIRTRRRGESVKFLPDLPERHVLDIILSLLAVVELLLLSTTVAASRRLDQRRPVSFSPSSSDLVMSVNAVPMVDRPFSTDHCDYDEHNDMDVFSFMFFACCVELFLYKFFSVESRRHHYY